MVRRLISAAILSLATVFAVAPAGAQTQQFYFPLRVLAYNIYMRPLTLAVNGQTVRAKLLPAKLRGYDVIIFSEAFDDDVRGYMLDQMRADYPHATRILGSDGTVGQDGGVIILSRWPIEAQDQRAFGGTCGGIDCQADKGVLYAKIRAHNRAVHIFGSHTQAHPGPAEQEVRRRQFEIMADFIASKNIPASEPILIGGDLNVDRRSNPAEFDRMLSILSATMPAPRGHGYTFDPSRNRLAAEGNAEYLDYVLYARTHQAPRNAYNEVLILRSDRPWKDLFFERDYYDLSDHYPVLGYFEFPGPPPRPAWPDPIRPTIPVQPGQTEAAACRGGKMVSGKCVCPPGTFPSPNFGRGSSCDGFISTTAAPTPCKSGFVWRLAGQSDFVCVPPAVFALVQDENRLAPNRAVGGPDAPASASLGATQPAQPMPQAEASFSGNWISQTNRGPNLVMQIVQNGREVSGNYVTANGERGRLVGRFGANVLQFNWEQAGGFSGTGQFNLSPDGNSFTGSFRANPHPKIPDPRFLQGSWNGRRQ